MNREKRGTGEVGEKHEGKADDKVDKIALYIEPEVMRADGEHTPFTKQNEDRADNP